MTSYGKLGGIGQTRGKSKTYYNVPLPSGAVVKKGIFRDVGATAIATGFMHNGKPHVVVWEDAPAWEGDYGRLTATRI